MRRLAPLGARLAPLFLALSACSHDSPTASADLKAPLDLSVPQSLGGVDLTGRWASLFSFDVGGAGAGAPLELLTVWTAYEHPSLTAVPVDTTWLLCALPVPGFLDVPYQVLNPGRAMATGALATRDDGASYHQPTVAFVLGAQLGDLANDPLPSDASKLCADDTSTGCVQRNTITGGPGLGLSVHGLKPDVDLLYVVLRARWAFDARATLQGTLDGDVSSASIEFRVLGCRLRVGGAACSPSEVAAIEALHAPIDIRGGKVRSHAQGGYFTCPQFISNPRGAATGVEVQDAGPGDLPHVGFADHVQPDLDARGCATGGCHDALKPPKLHLIYQPQTMTDLMANYQAVLPWTMGNPMPGGRFVNEVPVPTAMRARWLQWEEEGTPY